MRRADDVQPLALGGTGATTAAGARDALGVRERLTAARTYYVRTDGNDNNTGLVNSSSGAFATLQRAAAAVASVDVGVGGVTISIGAGTFTAGAIFDRPPVGGIVSITGAGAGSTIISTSSSTPLDFSNSGTYSVSGMRLESAGTNFGVRVTRGAHVFLASMSFGAFS